MGQTVFLLILLFQRKARGKKRSFPSLHLLLSLVKLLENLLINHSVSTELGEAHCEDEAEGLTHSCPGAVGD